MSYSTLSLSHSTPPVGNNETMTFIDIVLQNYSCTHGRNLKLLESMHNCYTTSEVGGQLCPDSRIFVIIKNEKGVSWFPTLP